MVDTGLFRVDGVVAGFGELLTSNKCFVYVTSGPAANEITIKVMDSGLVVSASTALIHWVAVGEKVT